MRSKILAGIVSLLTIAGISFISTGTAHADGPRFVGATSVNYCHGGNCNLGLVTGIAQIRQWASTDNQTIYGSEASCAITITRGASNVQVERTALGIVGGQALSVDTTNHNSNGTGTAGNTNPFPPTYVATEHISNSSGFDIRTACQFTIRWSDGQLSSVLAQNSLQSNDYFCVDSPNIIGTPCDYTNIA